MPRSAASSALVLTGCLLLPGLASAQLAATQESRICIWGADATTAFGGAVALSGSTAFVGDSASSANRGAVFVMQDAGLTWPVQQKIVPADVAALDAFGSHIAYDGARVAIASPGTNGAVPDAGAVYIYAHDGTQWVLQDRVFASDGAAGESFSRSIALDGDTLAVGANGHSGTAFRGGAVYVYGWDGISWVEQQKIVSVDLAAQDRFGTSVALQGDRLIVGALQDTDNGMHSGSAYVFERTGSTWAQVTKLLASDGTEGDFFGTAVAMDGNTVAVSAPSQGTTPVFEPGAVYVYRYDGSAWNEEQKVTAFVQDSFSRYGTSIALQGDHLIVGAPDDGPGKVFHYDGTGGIWIERASIQDWSTATGFPHFGSSVALSGTTVLAGEPDGRWFSLEKGVVGVMRIGSPSFSPSRIYVDADAPPGGDGGSWASAYDSLDLAMLHTEGVAGSPSPVLELWIAEGTYKPTTNQFDSNTLFELRSASIHGGFSGTETSLSQQDPAAHPTILSGDILDDDLPQHVNYSDNSDVVLDLVSLQATLEVSGLVFRGADEMALVVRGDVTVRDCAFEMNVLGLRGLLGSGPVPSIDRCSFTNNYSPSTTPALQISYSGEDIVLVSDCSFEGNTTLNSSSAGAVSAARTHFRRCAFIDNESNFDAGALRLASDSVVTDSVFMGNQARLLGGAIYSEAQNQDGNGALVMNCLFSGNESTTRDGGAVYLRNSDGAGPTFVGCTFSRNTAARDGGAIFANGSSQETDPILRNSVFWQNTDQSGSGEASQIFTVGMAAPAIDSCCVEGWTGALGGTGNTGADPLFVDPAGPDLVAGTSDDDCRLLSGSAAIDAGSAIFLPMDITDQDGDGDIDEPISRDLDGNSRVISLAPDMGPYEYSCIPTPSFCDAGDDALSACPCGNAGNPDTGCDIQQSTGGVALCVWGQATSPQNALTLRGSGFSTMGSPAVIVIRGSGSEANPIAFGDGLRCVSTPLVRLGAAVATNGVSSHEFGHGAKAGTGDFYYQLWFRNTPSSFCTPDAFNLSNGRVVSW